MGTLKRKVDVPKHIDPLHTVTLKSMGNIKEILISDRSNSSPTIFPISKDEFVVVSTGEVKKVEHHAVDRTENIRNLEKTMRALSDLINANISQENLDNCRFITLTYKENMKDPDKLYNDFRNFNKRFKRYINRSGYHYEYIVTLEAQNRGSFHLHGIYIFDSKAPYIENKVLAKMWGLGFVSIKALDKNVDNIGKYLTAYLTDLPIDEDTELLPEIVGNIKESKVGDKNKRIIKGARLKMLPVGIRIYRYSKGINKPVITKLTYNDATDFLSKQGFTKVNEFALEITDTQRDFKSNFIKQTYKKHINTERK